MGAEPARSDLSYGKRAEATRGAMTAYFLRLGALGFGGPIALVETMRRDLVEARGWLTEAEYELGLAIAAACPGPLAYQLGVYCGYVRFGAVGASSVAVAFALAPFLLVVSIAAAYTRFSASGPVRALFYGMGPIVLALVLRAALRLGTKTLRRQTTAWVVAVLSGVVTVIARRELTLIFLLAGLAGTVLLAGSSSGAGERRGSASARSGVPLSSLAIPVAAGLDAKLFLFFFKTGCLVFGSGLVIVPFLETYVVREYGWLGSREFVDAVSIGMISPGPVVITATFVGYLVHGVRGAFAATAGIFSPAIFFTILATPLLTRHGAHPRLAGFIRGITASVVGVLAGTIVLIAPAVVTDVRAGAIALAAAAIRFGTERVPDVALIAAGALAGLALAPA